MLTVTDIARICHEANRAYCEATGDHSQKSWDEAEAWQRESAVQGVVYALANPQAGPSDQHYAWMRDKVAAGWSYGPEKDAEARTHPCLVPYQELPVEQRRKDALFLGIVRALSVH
jgi:hypothetical protein